MNIKKAREKIEDAMDVLTKLACELPPDNGMTRKELDIDEEFDSVSIFGQYAYISLREALKALDEKEKAEQ